MILSIPEKNIIKTLAYYDIFLYPLTAKEIFHNLKINHTSEVEVEKLLSNLVEKKLLYSKGKYYLLKDDNSYINRREKGNKIASKRIKTAKRMSWLISKFPFIRAILLSGSISKGFMNKDSDIDYFVVTHPNRVWFSRAVLMIFKKIFLLNSRRIFCINYFVDSENLEIEEKNIFTATEITTLIPTFGLSVYDELYNKNIWVKQFYPNFPKRVTDTVQPEKKGIFKTTLEKILEGKLGNKLDDYFMKMFEKYYVKRYSEYDPKEFKIAFKSSKNESKHHPKFFQKKILHEFNKKIKVLEAELQVSLN
ncbi:MAG: nucleotidyltransferase domain-containing protein [Ignavibacteria bacterium]|nr:nucleotidyltransferase domain-containing protein [Ignavibacteria bacterium]MBT8381676.1 nucleotidyltransferase domain-containing protein [Ignavibacteria bacterium]MBT8392007.1 nucleotidyltransferase domain-containing protein [Ignavibacteria bacterium]NNJ54294.1 nucleotidyltransferase domain-containing protein [Ignavibacteriaceae bacterium]NNL20445.1 nucleotidyltransferase domain-containing protein [Ignavibacteriaceae bacterium]